MKERWYETLHDWENALKAYQHGAEQNQNDMELVLGQMRCLEVLGEWSNLHELAGNTWGKVVEQDQQKMARMAAAAAWGLGNWESMEKYTNFIPRDTTDGAFYQAVLAVYRDKFQIAQGVS